MRKYLRKIFRIFAVQWSVSLQYRGDIIIWTLTNAIAPLIALAIWFTVASQGVGSLEPRDTLTYYILAMLVITAVDAWVSYFLTQEILDGTIVQYLTRPFSIFLRFTSNNIVEKFLKLFIPLPLTVLIFLLIPQYFSSSLYEPWRIFLAIMSVVLGASVAFLVDALLACVAFWIEDAHQILGYHYLLWTIGSGVLIPYIFLPEVIKTIFTFLPYRYIVSAPIEILISSSSNTSPTTLIAIQLAWLVGLIIALRFLWLRGLKRYAIPGQ